MVKERNEGSFRTAATAAERMRHYRARQRGENVPKRSPGPRPKRKSETIPAHPSTDRHYALDFHSPVRHVATELEKAGRTGAAVTEMARTYQHSVPTDLSRVQKHHGCVTNNEAIRFLIDRAVSALGNQVAEGRSTKNAIRYRLAVPFDELRFDGALIVRVTDE